MRKLSIQSKYSEQVQGFFFVVVVIVFFKKIELILDDCSKTHWLNYSYPCHACLKNFKYKVEKCERILTSWSFNEIENSIISLSLLKWFQYNPFPKTVYCIWWEHQKHFHFLFIQDYKKIQLIVAILFFILLLALILRTEHPFLLTTDMTLHKSHRKALYAGNDMVKKKVLPPFYIIFPSVSLWSDPEFYYESQLPTTFFCEL